MMPRSRLVALTALAATWALMASTTAVAQTTRLSLADLQAQIQALRSSMTCPPALPGEARFLDKGDGTFCDAQTGLQWETKVTDPSSPSWVGRTSSWSFGTDLDRNGTLFTSWLPALNRDAGLMAAGVAWPVDGCRGGHCDWRVPTVAELRSLVCAGASIPCTGGAPWPGQTAVGSYWTGTSAKSGTTGSETSFVFVLTYTGTAWHLQQAVKSSELFMRAVRSTR